MTRFAAYATPDGFRAAGADAATVLTGLPAWGRLVVLLAALPGIALILLSLAALLASVATLLALAVPAHALMRRLAGLVGGGGTTAETVPAPRPARRVEATVID